MTLVGRTFKRVLFTIPAAFALSTGTLIAACQTAKSEPHVAADPGELAVAQTAAVNAVTTLETGASGSSISAATALALRPSDFTIEVALPEFRIALDDLARAKEQAQLFDTGRKVYVMSGQSYRSAVYMRSGANGWAVSQIHGKDLGDALGDTLAALRAKVRADNDDFFVVDVSGMHLTLIGHREKGALYLTPSSDRSDLNLTAKTVSPASELLPRLALEAQRWMAESARTFGNH